MNTRQRRKARRAGRLTPAQARAIQEANVRFYGDPREDFAEAYAKNPLMAFLRSNWVERVEYVVPVGFKTDG